MKRHVLRWYNVSLLAINQMLTPVYFPLEPAELRLRGEEINPVFALRHSPPILGRCSKKRPNTPDDEPRHRKSAYGRNATQRGQRDSDAKE